MNTIRIERKTGGHFEYYEFHGSETNGRFTVKGLYGRIGQAPRETIIYDGDSKGEANKEFQKKMNAKLKNHYLLVSQNGKATPAAVEKKTLIFQ